MDSVISFFEFGSMVSENQDEILVAVANEDVERIGGLSLLENNCQEKNDFNRLAREVKK